MEERIKLQWGMACFGAMLFNVLFWKEEIGLNLSIFGVFAVLGQRVVFKDGYSMRSMAAVGGVFLSSCMVAWHGSAPAKLGAIASLALAVGFLQHERLHSLFYAAMASASAALRMPSVLWGSLRTRKKYARELSQIGYYARLVVIPIFIFSIFLAIFCMANPVFAGYVSSVIDWANVLLGHIFERFSPARLLFLMLGLAISAWLFIRHKALQHYADSEAGMPDALERKRLKIRRKSAPISSMALKKEHLMGLLAMGAVSLMAGIVNGIDIYHVWFNFQFDGAMNLSGLVHEGTYILIFSILLSMMIMLYYFRGNQNFYSRADALRWLAYIWIAQNVVMAISVGIRNYHYIAYYGLAYKRIGVIFFLLLTLFGLATLTYKIAARRSVFYLLKINAWAVYAALLAMGGFNWDALIARHNLSHRHKENIDIEFLLTLSDKALPILYEHEALFRKTFVYTKGWRNDSGENAFDVLEARKRRFLESYEAHSWLSFSWEEMQAAEAFK